MIRFSGIFFESGEKLEIFFEIGGGEAFPAKLSPIKIQKN